MPSNTRWSGLAVLICSSSVVLASGLGAQKSAPAVPDILKAAAGYVVQYSEKLQAVGAEEDYQQMDTSGGQINHIRRLSGDAVMLGLGDGHSAMFRDIYAIDQKLLHERTPRLLKLFEEPPGQAGGALLYASQFTQDSIRQYVNGDLHTLDSPLAPLELLREDYQSKVTFKIDSMKVQDGAQVAVLKFTENSKASLLMTPPGMAVTGRFWIDAASGVVRESEVTASDKYSMVKATVTYALDKASSLWLPQELSQRFDLSIMGSGGDNGQREHTAFDTHAKYTQYRQVKIDLDKIR